MFNCNSFLPFSSRQKFLQRTFALFFLHFLRFFSLKIYHAIFPFLEKTGSFLCNFHKNPPVSS